MTINFKKMIKLMKIQNVLNKMSLIKKDEIHLFKIEQMYLLIDMTILINMTR